MKKLWIIWALLLLLISSPLLWYDCIYWNFKKRTVDARWTTGTPHIHIQTALCVPRTVVSCICWKWAVGSGLFSAISAFSFCICLRSVLLCEYGKCLLSVSRIGGNGGHTDPGDGRRWMRCVSPSLSLNGVVCACVCLCECTCAIYHSDSVLQFL